MKQNAEEQLSGAMNPTERRAAVALASVFALRMLGLFMILPVFSLYADAYRGYTATLAGVAIGAYGLTQAVLQIPFGMLSDRIGRKPVIIAGLLLFAAGSVVAALSSSILGVIAGRALQGAGAIAAAVMALTADLTREEQRTKAMAIIGGSIGVAFAAALIVGPIISRWWGLAGVFWITALLAMGGIAVVKFLVPRPERSRFHRDAEPVPAQFSEVLRDTELLRLDAGILLLHLILTASFVVLPLVLRDHGALAAGEHWKIYLLVLVTSVILITPLILFGERLARPKQIFAGAVLTLGLAQAGLGAFHPTLWPIVVLMIVFFTAFNLLEATLPALVSRFAPSDKKGTALGLYSTSQFLGAFLGGLSGGWLYGQHGAAAVFALCAALAGIWFLFAVSMKDPSSFTNRLLKLGTISEQQASRVAAELSAIRGVAEAVVIVEDGIAYLKVDRKTLDEPALRAFSTAGP